MFQFCNLKNQQRFILDEEMSDSLKDFPAILNTLRQFSKQYDKAVKIPLYPLPKPKQEIGLNFIQRRTLCTLFPRHQRSLQQTDMSLFSN